MKKNAFLLIEVLIAITLIAFFGMAFLKPSLHISQKKLAYLEKMELEKLSRQYLVEIKQNIFEKKITLPSVGSSSLRGELPSASLNLGSKHKVSYVCHYTIQRTSNHRGSSLSTKKAQLYTLTLSFQKKKRDKALCFTYPLYAEEVRAV